MKEATYKTMVRPILEYGSSVWDPYTKGHRDELEKVQHRAARFVTRNYTRGRLPISCVPMREQKNDEKGYFFRAGQCAALSSFRVGKMLFL